MWVSRSQSTLNNECSVSLLRVMLLENNKTDVNQKVRLQDCSDMEKCRTFSHPSNQTDHYEIFYRYS